MVCGQDCADKPRVKDEQGNYACRECADAATKRSAAAKVAVVAGVGQQQLATAGVGAGRAATAKVSSPEPELTNPGVWDDLTPVVPKGAKACGSCGHAMKDEAIVCLNCGHNELTGKALRTKREKPLVIGEVKRKREVDPSERAAFWVPLFIGAGLGGFIWASAAQQSLGQMFMLLMALGFYGFIATVSFVIVLLFNSGLAKLGGIAMASAFIGVIFAAFSGASPEFTGIMGLLWIGGAIFGLILLWKEGEHPLVRGMVCGSVIGQVLLTVAMVIYGDDIKAAAGPRKVPSTPEPQAIVQPYQSPLR